MPEATDPANARLALRRLVASLVRSNPEKRPDDSDATLSDLLGLLDSDEMADYDTVASTLEEVQPPRFAVVNWNGWALLDLRHAIDVHGTGEALIVIAGDEAVVRALAAVLNDDPSKFDAHFPAGDVEPF